MPKRGCRARDANRAAHPEGTARNSLLYRGNSVLRRGSEVRASGTGAAFGHELIELGLVLRHPQASQEVAKLPLLLFQALQRVLAILVKRAIAARPRGRPPRSGLTHLVRRT